MNSIVLDKDYVKSLLPLRREDGNKGTFGRVLIVCGSKKMVGCCVLAAQGALRSGAGLVEIAFPDVLYTALTSRLTETLFLPLETDEHGEISHLALPAILEAADKADVVVCGCGMGTGYGAHLVTTSLISVSRTPLILDADSLNCLADAVNFLKNADCEILLTPHPGEMARLTDKTVQEIQADREKNACDFCRDYNVNLLLKGQNTVICNRDVSSVCVNPTGNSGLAKGGAGDLLSGIIGGIAAQNGGRLFDAACVGAYVHGFAADLICGSYTEYCMLPSDCAYVLPAAFTELLK